MRLFYALELPDLLREEIGRVQSLLRPAGADVRWVDPETAHVTVKFLGEVDADEIVPLDRAVAPAVAAASRARVKLGGLGAFPPPGDRPPRVLWVGLDGETERLVDLNTRLETALAEEGFPPEERPYRPHVTIGRVRGRRGTRRLRRSLEEHHDVELGEMVAAEVVLLESELKSDGPRYHRMAGYPIGG